MTQVELEVCASRAKQLYEASIRSEVEPHCLHKYVSIEPDSGRDFIGDTFSEAVAAARAVFPERLTHTVRVGHSAALHFGAATL